MKRFLNWLLRRKPAHIQGDPDNCPACPPRPHLFECDCGRQHPEGWICGATIGGRL